MTSLLSEGKVLVRIGGIDAFLLAAEEYLCDSPGKTVFPIPTGQQVCYRAVTSCFNSLSNSIYIRKSLLYIDYI